MMLLLLIELLNTLRPIWKALGSVWKSARAQGQRDQGGRVGHRVATVGDVTRCHTCSQKATEESDLLVAHVATCTPFPIHLPVLYTHCE